MNTGEFRQDGDSHWYIIPDNLLEEFDKMSEELEGKDYLDCVEVFERFEELFGEYRTGGSYTGYKVIIDSDNK